MLLLVLEIATENDWYAEDLVGPRRWKFSRQTRTQERKSLWDHNLLQFWKAVYQWPLAYMSANNAFVLFACSAFCAFTVCPLIFNKTVIYLLTYLLH